MESEKEYVRIPRELTDHIAEAIAFEARCCGGIAYDIAVDLEQLNENAKEAYAKLLEKYNIKTETIISQHVW